MMMTTVLSLLVIYTLITPVFAAYTTPVSLGDATSFAVLAGSTVTNTGSTTLSGTAGNNLGVSAGTAVTGVDLITMGGGTVYTGAPGNAADAQVSLTAAFTDAAGRTPATAQGTELGNLTLVSGVYASTTFGLTGTLTLDAENDPTSVFIFQAASTLITANNSNIVLANGADACNIFWVVGTSATLGTGSTLYGHVLAQESITATTGATIYGSLLARIGAVTLDTNTIVNNACTTPVVEEEEEETPVVVPPVTPPVETPVETTTPSPLPATSSPLDIIFMIGGALVLLGAAGGHTRKKVFKLRFNKKIKTSILNNVYPIIMLIGLGLVTLSLINLYIQSNRIVTVVYPVPITETQVDTSILANGEIETETTIVQTTAVEKPKWVTFWVSSKFLH